MNTTCKYCGAPLEANSNVCEYCGKEVYHTVKVGKADTTQEKRVFKDERRGNRSAAGYSQAAPQPFGCAKALGLIVLLFFAITMISYAYRAWTADPVITNNGEYFEASIEKVLKVINRGKEDVGILKLTGECEKNKDGEDVYSAEAENGIQAKFICNPGTKEICCINIFCDKSLYLDVSFHKYKLSPYFNSLWIAINDGEWIVTTYIEDALKFDDWDVGTEKTTERSEIRYVVSITEDYLLVKTGIIK